MVQFEGQGEVQHVKIHYDKPAYLKYDANVLRERFPRLVEAKQRLIEQNFELPLFLPAHVIDQQIERRIRDLIRRPIVIRTDAAAGPDNPQLPGSCEPFP